MSGSLRAGAGRRTRRAAGLGRGSWCLTLLLLLPAVLQAQTGVVRGRVRSEATGAPLVAAVVEVRGVAPARSATVGAGGSYELRDVPAGRRLIRAHHMGYLPFEAEVMVPAGREMELDIVLRAAPVLLDPVRVEGGGSGGVGDTVAVPSADLSLAGARVMQSSPGIAELGLADAARGAPGQEPVDPSDVLYVRGAGTDLKLVYLDGAPVYAPFPLGGLIDPFTPDLLGSAEIYLGGAPARYDGGLSYVLDLTTRGVRTDRPHLSGATDLLAARGLVEVPVGSRAGVLVAGRSVHDMGTGQIARHPLPYGYREGLARVDVGIGRSGMLSLTGFANGEEVWLSSSDAPDSVIRWGNSALSLRYRGSLGGTSAELTAALGDFEARLPVGGSQAGLIDGWAERGRLSADFLRRDGRLAVRYGASFDRQRQGYLRTGRSPGSRAGMVATGDVAGAYADVGWQLSPRVRLRGGLRADHYSLGSKLVTGPRIAATWLVTERAALTLAAGRYHQYLRPTEGALLAADVRVPASVPPPLAVGSSSHVALSLDQEVGDGIRFGVEGFFKGFEGIPGGDAAAANASGVDVWVRRSEGRWTGWAGYSLAWVWSLPDRNQNTRFAGRHLLTSGLGVPLGERGRVNLGFVYGAGLPYSAIPLSLESLAGAPRSGDSAGNTRLASTAGSAPLLPEPTRPYLRFDLSASRTWTRQWGGTQMDLSPYVRLLNTFGQRDALFYRFERERDSRPRPLVAFPLVPVFGLEWKF